MPLCLLLAVCIAPTTVNQQPQLTRNTVYAKTPKHGLHQPQFTPNHGLHQPRLTPKHGLHQPRLAPTTVYTNHRLHQPRLIPNQALHQTPFTRNHGCHQPPFTPNHDLHQACFPATTLMAGFRPLPSQARMVRECKCKNLTLVSKCVSPIKVPAT